MVEEGETTLTVESVEKDGTVVVKTQEGSIRYVKEADLLSIKGSKESLEAQLKEVAGRSSAEKQEAENKAESARQEVLKAEARITSLEDQIKQGGGTAEELAQARKELEAAKSSGEALGNKHLELRREVIMSKYGVPKETVESKNLDQLELFEEALRAVVGKGGVGNYAAGGGGGGANALQGKSPMELAQMAYESSK